MTEPKLQTFTFEGHYRESDGGNRCDVITAFDREQALALAGRAIVEDNSWDDKEFGWDAETFAGYSGFADLYTSEVKIDSGWTDLNGKACPNCTSHGGQDTQVETEIGGTVHECRACGYQWVPLGKKADHNKGHPTREQIDAELEQRWKELIGEAERTDADD